MQTFVERLDAVEEGERDELLALVADRFEAVDRAQALVGQHVADHTRELEDAERELDRILDAIRSDLRSQGVAVSEYDTNDLVAAANEGRVSDELQERIAETLPKLRESAAAGQQASADVDGLLQEITAESRLYHRLAGMADEPQTTVTELKEAIRDFVLVESSHGGEEATAVDVVLARYDPEWEPTDPEVSPPTADADDAADLSPRDDPEDG
jgi:hypothetical protein